MGKAPAYQMYAQDFDMDTASWSNDEVGMYTRLLNYEWINGSIPSHLEEIARITREPYSPRFHAKFTAKWMRNVAAKFTQNGNGNLINKRLEQVRQIQSKYSESRRKNVSIRYKNKATHEPTYEEHSSYINPTLQSSSSSSSLNQKNKRSISHSETKIFLTYYAQQFKQEFGTDPVIEWGKDGKIIKGLLKFIPLENLKDLLNKFFSSEDKFIQKSGYTIGVFKSQLNKLKIGEATKDGMDLWLKVKEAQDERRGKKEICIINEKAEGDIPEQPER